MTVNSRSTYRRAEKSTYYNALDPSLVTTYFKVDADIDVGPTTRTYVSDPSWQSKIAYGQNASNPYRRRETKVGTSSIAGKAKQFDPLANQTIWSECVSRSAQGSFPDVSGTQVDGQLNNLALARIKRKLDSDIGQFKALCPLAELGEMRGLLHQGVYLTREMLLALIDIKRTKGRSAFKFAADCWLGFNFGIRPVLKDIDEACQAIAKALHERPHKLRVSGTAHKDWCSGASTETSGAFGANILTDASFKHQLSYRYVGAFSVDIQTANNYGVQQQLGLLGQDLIPALWEFMPWSWVVDYFTTTGEFFSDVFNTRPTVSTYITGSRRYTIDGDIHRKFRANPNGPRAINTLLAGSSGTSKFRHFDFERSLYSTLPVAALRFKSVDEIGKSSVNKLLNLASVLVSGRDSHTLQALSERHKLRR